MFMEILKPRTLYKKTKKGLRQIVLLKHSSDVEVSFESLKVTITSKRDYYTRVVYLSVVIMKN